MQHKWSWMALALAGAGLALALLGWGGFSGSEPPGQTPLYEVKPQPLVIEVLAAGTLRAQQRTVIKNELHTAATVLEVVPEGTLVDAGDLLIKLDDSALQDELQQQQVKVAVAESGVVQAQEELAVTRNRAQSEEEQVELKLRLARQEWQQYRQGRYPQELKETQARVTLAEETLQRAEEKLRWSEILYEDKYISQTELEADRLAARKAELELQLKRDELKFLRQYSHQRQVLELKGQVRELEQKLKRTRRAGSADILQAEAQLKAKEAEAKQARNRLQRIQEDIANATIHAPTKGMVVYAGSTKVNFRNNNEPLAAGSQVSKQEELIYLPDPEQLVAKVHVPETQLESIAPGQQVRLQVDAQPGRTYRGEVQSISVLPDASRAWLNPELKLYRTEILLQGDNPGLRTGMSCTAHIEVERLPQRLSVPWQAVVLIEDQAYVYCLRQGHLVWQQVSLGRENGLQVAIKKGLQAGDRVSLNPPRPQRQAGEGDA